MTKPAVVALALLLSVGLFVGTGCNDIVGNEVGYLRALPAEGVEVEVEDGGIASDANVGPLPEPEIVCKVDEKVCFKTCVPNLSSGFGCASKTSCDPCPQPDHATPACNGAVCGSVCKDGYDNCDTSNADCETDLSSASTCGKCNAKCPVHEPFCVPSGTTFQCMSTCRPGTVSCNAPNQCFDLQTNPQHCGACGKACPEPPNSTATCGAGACAFTCNPGFHSCGGRCVLDTDVNACGASCTACAAPANMNVACENGTCATACKGGWANCDGDPSNGCESNTTHDTQNCGACGLVCLGKVERGGDQGPIGPIGPACCVNSRCARKLCAL